MFRAGTVELKHRKKGSIGIISSGMVYCSLELLKREAFYNFASDKRVTF